MKVRILGSGTSSGVPRIGNDWGSCDRDEPRNRRSRSSVLVSSATTTILVDTSPDMREQLLAARTGRVDAVIWTHDHADHSHGIDDLRQIFFLNGGPIRCYARPQTLAILSKRFDYAFAGANGYPPTIDARPLPDELRIGDIAIRVTDQPHGRTTSAGLRFEADGAAFGHATDFSSMTADMASLYESLDLWAVDALREKPHPTHPTVADVIGWVEALAPGRTVLTHMDQSMDYRSLLERLPAGIEPSYDGMEIELA